MKKNMHINFVLLLMISLGMRTLNMYAQTAQDAKSHHIKKEVGAVNLPKKIRISSKQPQLKVMAEPPVQTPEKIVSDTSSRDTQIKVSELEASRVEIELEKELLAMQKNAGKQSQKKNMLDAAITQLANTVRDQEVETHQTVSTHIAQGATQEHNEVKANIDLEDADTQSIDENIVARDSSVVISEAPHDRKRLYLGRAYNYAVIEEQEEKRFVVPTAFFASYAFRGFDNCSREVPLSNILINSSNTVSGTVVGANGLQTGNFTVGDIFLEARLSAQVVGNPTDDQSILFLDVGGPGNFVQAGDPTPAQFGNRRRQQYLGLLAPVEVRLDTDAFCFTAQSGFIYRFYIDECQQVASAFGIIIPVVSKFQSTCFTLEQGKLYDRVEFAAKDATPRESTVFRYFNDFSYLEDFFQRAVLEPKGLSIVCRQQRIGIGDISLFGLVDFAPSLCHLDSLQIGLSFSLPTSNKAIGDTLFEIELDDGGAFQIEPFANVIFSSGNKFFNPMFYITGNFSIPFTAQMRVPHLVSHNQVVDTANAQGLANDANRVTNIPGLIAPVMREFFALSFSQLDSLVPEFADTVSTVRLSKGPRVIAGIGNYFYDVFSCNFRFGFFYDFTAQGANQVCSTDCVGANLPLDTSSFKCNTAFAHRIGLNLTYKFGCGEINVGGQFTIAGKNVPKINEAFASFIAVF